MQNISTLFQTRHPSIHPSIHPSSTAYPESSLRGSSFSSEPQTSVSPAMLANFDWGIPRRSQAREEMKSLHLVLGLPLSLLPVGYARSTSWGRHPGGILIRCPNHLNWLLSTQRSNGSIPGPFRWLRFSPYLYWRPQPPCGENPFQPCTRDLILSIMTHRSWP